MRALLRAELVAAVAALGAFSTQVVMLAVAIVLLQGKGVEPTLEAADLAAMGGIIPASALWATIGVAVGALLRMLLVENLGAGALGEASTYLPGQAGHGVVA